LKKIGFDVSLIVADGKGNTITDGINIYDVGKPKNRYLRAITKSIAVFKKGLQLDCDCYHIHDPELLLYVRLLLKENKKVIYDVHEDVPNQIIVKPYIPKLLKKPISSIINFIEKKQSSKLYGIVAATPYIHNLFALHNTNVITICNYPLLSENVTTEQIKKKQVCYFGVISKDRGVNEMCELAENFSIAIGGVFESEQTKNFLLRHKFKMNLNYLGICTREKVISVYQESTVGLCLLHPTKSYFHSLPIKVFEYMLAGIPVICSDFPILREIVEDNNAGFCLGFDETNNIKAKIQLLFEDRDLAKELGENGKKAVLEKYNWVTQEEKLKSFYQNIN
jgi:glycosyltransferase involved in cell wall biosynthesis